MVLNTISLDWIPASRPLGLSRFGKADYPFGKMDWSHSEFCSCLRRFGQKSLKYMFLAYLCKCIALLNEPRNPTGNKMSQRRRNDVPLYIPATSQICLKWRPVTSRWNVSKASQWYVSKTSYWNIVTTSQEYVTTTTHQYVFSTSQTSLK